MRSETREAGGTKTRTRTSEKQDKRCRRDKRDMKCNWDETRRDKDKDKGEARQETKRQEGQRQWG